MKPRDKVSKAIEAIRKQQNTSVLQNLLAETHSKFHDRWVTLPDYKKYVEAYALNPTPDNRAKLERWARNILNFPVPKRYQQKNSLIKRILHWPIKVYSYIVGKLYQN